ncbi:MAG: CPBP family glutamic-type intramembrane protease [Bacilli bacterium]|nr:CPBP family glutamic-type intramembrane protease [Bacilli bacterium]
MNKDKKQLILNIIIITLYFLIGILGFPKEGNINAFSKIIPYYYVIGILFILILFLIYKKDLINNFKALFSEPKKNILQVLKYFLISFGGFIILRIIAVLLIGENATSQIDNPIIETYKYFPIYVIFQTIIYCQFVEEMIFRKCLNNIIKNKYIYILISSIIFSYLHLIGNYSNVLEYLILFLPYFYLGCVLAYIYQKTNNVLITIFIRLIYNSFVTLLIAFL